MRQSGSDGPRRSRGGRAQPPVSEAERRGRVLDEIVRRVDEHLPDSVSNSEEILAAIVNSHVKHVDSLRRRGEAFQFPFEEWADTEGRSSSTRRQRTVEAVATLADVTDVSAEVLVEVITEVLVAESEDDLVDALQSWVEADQPGQTSLDDPPFGDPPSKEPDSPQRPTGFDHQAGSPDGPTEEQPHDEYLSPAPRHSVVIASRESTPLSFTNDRADTRQTDGSTPTDRRAWPGLAR